jgi:hypothetical protein
MNTVCKKCGKEHGLFYYKRKGKNPVLGYWCNATPVVSHTRNGAIVKANVTFIPSDTQEPDLPVRTVLKPAEAERVQDKNQFQFAFFILKEPSKSELLSAEINRLKTRIARIDQAQCVLERNKLNLREEMRKLSLSMAESLNLSLPLIGESPTIKS